jgi:hypothetical protein
MSPFATIQRVVLWPIIYISSKAQSPIPYERLRELAGFDKYQNLRINHKKWVEASLQNQKNGRDAKGTRSLAFRSQHFIDTIKKRMGLAAKWRKQLDDGDSYQLRESKMPYGDHLGAKKR